MRLIDADALHKSIDTETYRHTYIEQIHEVIDNAPTIDKGILRKCKDKSRLCVHANVWNTCVDKPCEKGSKLLGKEADQFIVDEANAYTKGEKMTNREWLESLSDEELANVIGEYNPCNICATNNSHCFMSCKRGVEVWLRAEWNCPNKKKELTQPQQMQGFSTLNEDIPF